MERKITVRMLVVFITLFLLWKAYEVKKTSEQVKKVKTNNELHLYWFIPDGFRADPITFKIFDWAREGILPNIYKMMNNGSYGYSIPVFPGHTPTNTATLVTGATPKIHGIADGTMRVPGYPLKMVGKSGFSSVSKLVPPIWCTLEELGANVALLSMPGSTPPELRQGITLRGRWGGWGIDFPAVNFQEHDPKIMQLMGLEKRAFSFGSELTQFILFQKDVSSDWAISKPTSYNDLQEVELNNWGLKIYGLIYDSTNDGKENYDHILFSTDKKTILADVTVGQWSGWTSINLKYQTRNDYNINTPKAMAWERKLSEVSVDTKVNIRVIRLGEKGKMRVRFFYDNLNEYSIKPEELSEALHQFIGPMVDFVDNYPPQLVYYPEDKKVFIEEAKMSTDWHQSLVKYVLEQSDSDVILHNIYTPNQMLTSRWWLPFLDPKSDQYNKISEAERKVLWFEVLDLYKNIDRILGEILERAGENSLIVLSSDHGAIPLNEEVCLNNLFAKEGLLKFHVNPTTSESEIDWENSKVVYLQMNHIYINSKGLGGTFSRESSSDYENLRERVIQIMKNLKNDQGESPLAQILKWENANELNLPKNRVGDLVIANKPGFHWTEEVSEDLKLFKRSFKGGYKQAVLAEDVKGMWTPFILYGKGVKKNFKINQPIRHIDQYPTIMYLLGHKSPEFIEGKILSEVLEKTDLEK